MPQKLFRVFCKQWSKKLKEKKGKFFPIKVSFYNGFVDKLCMGRKI